MRDPQQALRRAASELEGRIDEAIDDACTTGVWPARIHISQGLLDTACVVLEPYRRVGWKICISDDLAITIDEPR